MKSMDLNNLTYTIRGMDEENQVLFVEFHGQGVVNIGLRGAQRPTTPEELDAFLKPYAAHKDAVAALQAPYDPSFIKSLIGRPRTTERYGSTLPPRPPKNEFHMTGYEEAESGERRADLEYIRDLLLKMLPEVLPQVLAGMK